MTSYGNIPQVRQGNIRADRRVFLNAIKYGQLLFFQFIQEIETDMYRVSGESAFYISFVLKTFYAARHFFESRKQRILHGRAKI